MKEHAAQTQNEILQNEILIVDDNVNNLKVVVSELKSHGFQVSVAQDGKTAIRLIKHSTPDLVLLDIMMPGIDGFETCRQLKEDPATSGIPIIFMTALSDSVDVLKGFEMGAADYITKPIDLQIMSARVKTHLTLQLQRKELVKLNATKNRFFSIIAHDLRNPLVSLISLVNIIHRGGDISPQKLKSFADHLKTATENTRNLLENLLTWAQQQQGGIVYRPTSLKLDAIVNLNLELFQTTAGQKGISFIRQVSSDAVVHADEQMITTVIRNLINNAIKYTDKGGEIRVIAHPVANDLVEISVTDNGVGISETGLARLFRIDQQHQQPGTSGEKGTGLGMILCKEFIEANNGRIWVESEVGKGTTVTLMLPIATAG